MDSLRLFGGLALEGPSGPLSGRVAQRRRLALLAMLGVAGEKGVSRDKLAGHLWPESDETGARHLLSDSVYVLRRALGEEAILAVGEFLRLNPDLVWCDVVAFEAAIRREKLEEAVDLYLGPFLDGFFLGAASELDQWLETERRRLADAYAKALESLAERAELASDYTVAVERWKQLAAHDPYNSRVVLRLMQALAAAGDPANALEYVRVHELRLREELAIEPPEDLRAYVERLRAEPVQISKAADVPTAVESGVSSAAELAAGEARGAHQRVFTWRNTGLALAIALGLWGVVTAGWLLLADRAEPEETRKSVAVLPFDNLSPDPENEYFADGVHDEIIAHLSKIADLKVISRTSVIEYKGRSGNLRAIAGELGVTNILEGTVRRADGRVRITTQLLDAVAGEHLWTEVYDRNLSDVFAVQSDVAQQVATALRATLTPAERERIEDRPTENLEAYEFYLQGSVYAHRDNTLPVQEAAQRMYERAVEIDPQFALAYARLSRVHSNIYHQGLDRTAERLRQAEDAVNRALELRPDLPEAHVALAHYYYRGFREYERALAALDVAGEALPGNVIVVKTRAWIAKRQGRFEEAVSLLREARRLDPRDWAVCFEMARNLEFLHRHVEAAAYYDTVLALEPDVLRVQLDKAWLRLKERGETDSLRSALEYLLARNYEFRGQVTSDRWYVEFFDRNYAAALDVLAGSERDAYFDFPVAGWGPTPLLAGFVHLAAGDPERAQPYFDSARRVLEVEVQEHPEDYRRLIALGLAYAGLGRRDEAVRAGLSALDLTYLRRDRIERGRTVRALVWIYAMLGEQEAAVDQLETYLALPSKWSVQAGLRDPRFDPLRHHQRFQALPERYEQQQ